MHYSELKTLLDGINGVSFATLDSLTDVRLKGGKANPLQGKVEKLAKGHRVMLCANKQSNAYLNKVRRHLEKEGKNPDSFKMQPPPWGERVPNSPFFTHTKKGDTEPTYYLQVIFLENGAGEIEYRHKETGEVIPKESIEGLPDKSGSEHQGLSNEVIVRAYKVESLVSVRAMGATLS